MTTVVTHLILNRPGSAVMYDMIVIYAIRKILVALNTRGYLNIWSEGVTGNQRANVWYQCNKFRSQG